MGKRIKRLKFLKEVEEEVVTLCKCDGCGRIIREANASYNCFKYGLKEIL